MSEPFSRNGLSYHSLSNAPLEEVAAAVRLRSEPTPGEAFIKKIRNNPEADRIKAYYSRSPVFHLYGDFPDTLRILTMPGLKWRFERGLVKYRLKHGLATQITSVECDPAIYRAALAWMPGAELSVRDNCTVVSDIAWFEYAYVEDVIERGPLPLDGAWLDFNGPLNLRRLEAIWGLWQQVTHSIVVTFLAARTPPEITTEFRRWGGWYHLFKNLLGVPVEVSPYLQHNIMVQITARKGGLNDVRGGFGGSP